jgi:hypothetical protein
MFKKALFLGIVSGLLAGIVSVAYARVYLSAVDDNFLSFATPTTIIVASLAGGVLAAIGYWALGKLFKQNGEIVFNFVFVILSFAIMLPVFGARLPREFHEPALFPGMVIPMHFFPALAWFTLKPLFFRQPIA